MLQGIRQQATHRRTNKIQAEAAAIKIKRTNYYLANELKRLLEIIENAHSPDLSKDPEEQQKQIDFAHERLFIFCKAFVIGLEANRDD